MYFVSSIAGPFDKKEAENKKKEAKEALKKLPFKKGRREIEIKIKAGNGLGYPGYYEKTIKVIEIQRPYGGEVPHAGYFDRLR
jgi:hypothetical protein